VVYHADIPGGGSSYKGKQATFTLPPGILLFSHSPIRVGMAGRYDSYPAGREGGDGVQKLLPDVVTQVRWYRGPPPQTP
jgi:hypothetical protein